MSTAVETKVIAVPKPGRFVSRKYNVIFHNDETTTFAFVMGILQSIFDHSITTAAEVTRKIHLEGKACVGTYSKEIAESKAGEAISASRFEGFPLVIELIEDTE